MSAPLWISTQFCAKALEKEAKKGGGGDDDDVRRTHFPQHKAPSKGFLKEKKTHETIIGSGELSITRLLA